MVILRIKQLDLDQDVDHLATDWEVSDTLNFSNIICKSHEDYQHLRGIIFNDVLDPNKKYYARARALTSNGYTIWGNLDVFTVDNTVELDKNEDLPSNVSFPIIKTKNIMGYLEPNEHDSALFTIEVKGFSVIGNAKLESTSYWIEDLNGNVIWSSIYNAIFKDEITVQDVILKANSIYRVKAMFHATNNNSSQISTLTIRTNGGSGIEVLTYLDNLDSSIDNTLEISTRKVPEKVQWEILSVINDFNQLVWSKIETNNSRTTLPKNTLVSNTNYLLRVGVEGINGFKVIPFKTK